MPNIAQIKADAMQAAKAKERQGIAETVQGRPGSHDLPQSQEEEHRLQAAKEQEHRLQAAKEDARRAVEEAKFQADAELRMIEQLKRKEAAETSARALASEASRAEQERLRTEIEMLKVEGAQLMKALLNPKPTRNSVHLVQRVGDHTHCLSRRLFGSDGAGEVDATEWARAHRHIYEDNEEPRINDLAIEVEGLKSGISSQM